MLHKKLLVALLVLLAALYLAACTPPEEESFDEEALLKITAYVEEMSAALTDSMLKADLMGWVREPYCEELPLRYDEERVGWLGEHAEKLEALRQKHLNEGFPPEEEIAALEVTVVRAGHEWQLQGEEVLVAVKETEALYADVTGTIALISQSEGELNLEQSQAVLKLIEELEPRAEKAGAVFNR